MFESEFLCSSDPCLSLTAGPPLRQSEFKETASCYLEMMFNLTSHKKSSVIILGDGYIDLSETKHLAVNKLINLVVLKRPQFDYKVFTIIHKVCLICLIL